MRAVVGVKCVADPGVVVSERCPARGVLTAVRVVRRANRAVLGFPIDTVLALILTDDDLRDDAIRVQVCVMSHRYS